MTNAGFGFSDLEMGFIVVIFGSILVSVIILAVVLARSIARLEKAFRTPLWNLGSIAPQSLNSLSNTARSLAELGKDFSVVAQIYRMQFERAILEELASLIQEHARVAFLDSGLRWKTIIDDGLVSFWAGLNEKDVRPVFSIKVEDSDSWRPVSLLFELGEVLEDIPHFCGQEEISVGLDVNDRTDLEEQIHLMIATYAGFLQNQRKSSLDDDHGID
jgi:hypothetical protein